MKVGFYYSLADWRYPVEVAVAAGDPQQSSPDSDDESAEQAGRPSSLLRDPEARKKSPPPVAGSDYESDEDCE